MKILEKMLDALSLPDTAKRLYLDLVQNGESSARTIATRLGVSRTSIYDQLEPLLTLRLVTEKDQAGKAFFLVHDLDDLDRLVAQQSESLASLRTAFKREKECLVKNIATTEPKIKFVQGREGVLSLLHEMLWESGGEILTVWPYHEMLKVVSADALDEFNKKRIRQNIAIKTIWAGPKVPAQHIWRGGDYKVERKVAPTKCRVPMGYSIYGHNVSFISSNKEQYGFVVNSEDFATLMRTQFASLWNHSK